MTTVFAKYDGNNPETHTVDLLQSQVSLSCLDLGTCIMMCQYFYMLMLLLLRYIRAHMVEVDTCSAWFSSLQILCIPISVSLSFSPLTVSETCHNSLSSSSAVVSKTTLTGPAPPGSALTTTQCPCPAARPTTLSVLDAQTSQVSSTLR